MKKRIKNMSDLRLNLVFIGRSGSGKGTQATLMKEFLEKRDGNGSVFYVYAGEIFRTLIKNQPRLEVSALLDAKVMKKGDKAPDFSAIWAWGNEFIYRLNKDQHIIVDGSPRTILEAKALDECLEFLDRENVFPILVGVSAEEVKQRMLLRGRQDDNEEQIKNRIFYYEKYVVPAIEYYSHESKNKLIVIDGNPHDVNLIHHSLLKALNL